MSTGRDNDAAATEVVSVLRACAPGLPAAIAEDAPIMEGGLEFDSVRAVELLLACEDHFGVPFPVSLLMAEPFCVGTLVDHVRQTWRP